MSERHRDFETLARRLPASAAASTPEALHDLLAGIAAAPPPVDDAWLSLVGQTLKEDVVTALRDMRHALAPDPPAMGPPIADRLGPFRQALVPLQLDGFLVPRSDEHQGEYVAAHSERLAWLTGFTGSAGVAIVLADGAALFVDGRYTIQARTQVDPAAFEIHHLLDDPPHAWLRARIGRGARIGFDSRLHTPRGLDKLRKVCEERGAELVPVTDNPVDAVWATQPPPPLGPAVPHPIEFAGTSVTAKRTLIADQLGREGDAAAVLTAPDSIAWLLNIRGADVPHTPLPLSFATIDDRGDVNLFLDPRKLTPEAHAHLGNDVVVQPPEAFGPHLDKLGHGGRVVRVDPAAASVWVFDRLHRAGATIRRDADPCALPKACKNAEELEGARAAHRRDAVAICRFLRWLSVKGPSGELTETGVVDRLLGFRSELPLFRDVSFDTIAGTGPNAAICHYRVTAASSRRVEPGALLLVDSGAQFLDGTTDITRTVAIGAPTPAMRRRFTLVLKGHIALATARFPEGTTGAQLDPFARQFLWRAGLDYDHGTGHGVGSYLSVHEGPQRLSKMPNGVALQPGMIVSNEPGYYEDNAYGIRIENLIAVRRATDVPDAPRPVLEFETLTLAPIDCSLVDPSLLTADELGWLNDYHARVRAVVGPQLTDEDKAWLEAVTEPIMPGASSTP